MNLFYKLASAAVFVAAALTAQADPVRVLNMDFTSDPAAKLAQMTVIKDDGHGWNPTTNTFPWGKPCIYMDGYSYTAKSYAVTPGVDLKAGYTYTFSVKATQYGGLNATLSLYVGKAATVAGLSTELLEATKPKSDGSNFQDFTSKEFVPEADGTYYFAICGQTRANGADIACNTMTVMQVASPEPDTPDTPDTPDNPNEEVCDVLTPDAFGYNTGATSYKTIPNVKITSDALYTAWFANGNNAIQLNNTKGNIITTESGGIISKIVINWNDNTANNRALEVYGNNTAYVAPADLNEESKAGTIIGTVTFNKESGVMSETIIPENDFRYVGFHAKNGALYINSIDVYWKDDAGVVFAPVFAPGEGFVTAGSTVAITTATEGAKIYYTMGEDPADPTEASTLYTAPIEITGEYTVIKAIAVLDGVASKVSTSSYMLVPEVYSLTALADFEDATPFIMAIDLVVAYVNGSNIYVYDPAGECYGMIYKYFENKPQPGQVILAGWQGVTQDYSGLQELVPDAIQIGTETAEIPQPTNVSADAAGYTLMPYNANGYFRLIGVTFDAATPAGKANFTGAMGETEVAFRNNYGVASVEPGTYNVVGFLGVYNGSVQFYPTSIDEPLKLNSVSELNMMPAETPFLVDCDLTVAYAVSDGSGIGINIVTDGSRFTSIMSNTLEPGNIIAKGWTAMYDQDQFIMFTADDSDIVAAGNAEAVPAPVPFTLNELYPNSYVIFDKVNLANGMPQSDEVFEVAYNDIPMLFCNAFNAPGVGAGEYEVTAMVMLAEDGVTYVIIPLVLNKLAAPEAEYVAYFNNGATAWETVYAYVWDAENTPVAAWPGEPATFDAEKNLWVYSFTTSLVPAHIIFNNGGNGSQTADLDFENEKVYGEAAPETAELYIRGDMNDWAADDAWKLATEDGVNYTLANVTIEAGVGFKIADANWNAAYNFGSVVNMALNTKYTLEKGAGTSNCTLAETMNNGTINFNVETGEVEFIGVADGIEAINAINGAEYFNLQGVKVERPAQGGLYIRVQGGKATKVLVK